MLESGKSKRAFTRRVLLVREPKYTPDPGTVVSSTVLGSVTNRATGKVVRVPVK